MQPHGGYKRVWPEDRGSLSRSAGKRAADEVPKHRAKKDTKRWCLGKVGRPHRPVWTEAKWSRGWSGSRSPDSVEVCSVCRKELRHVWGMLSQRLGPAF